ncbi:MAG: BadF/BadG/BcrA/BcrD ATPase family protein [Anaerolineales bacterium]|jgi:N-acetylglucosamine kinase-like BadF-type ATPase
MTNPVEEDFSFFEPLPTRMKKGSERSISARPSFQGYLLALEGGGTRSQAVLMDSQGKALEAVQSSDVNTNFTSYEQSQQAVQAAVRDVLLAAQVPGNQVNLCVSALVGPRFGAETYSDLLPKAVYHYYNEIDVVFARAGIYEPNGVGVVAGTGATAAGIRKKDHQTVIHGGWGALLGDEGSGYAMGLLGLRAAARASEGRTSAPTQLVEAITQHFNLPGSDFRFELVHLAYQKPLSRNEIAQVARVVTKLAAQNDPVAMQITQKVSRDLANLTLHAARQLFETNDPFDVVVSGGLTNAGDLVLAPLKEGLAKEFPHSSFHIGVEDPAAALGRLALHNISKQ